MWFGNANHMEWVACPQVDRPSSRSGWSASGGYLSGGSYVKRSLSGSKAYEMDFGLLSRDDARKITDFYDGVWGPGPFFWVDPMTRDKNVLTQNWASPHLQARDGVPLTVNRVRPLLVDTPANTRGLPKQSARYVINQSTASVAAAGRRLVVPVPPGHTLRVWAFGSADGTARLRLSRQNEGTSQQLVMNAPGGTTSTSSTIDGGASGNFAYFTADGVGNLEVTAVQAVIYQTGKPAPVFTEFVSGQGHSGCEFEEFDQSDYSAAMDKVGVSATLVEVGQWQ